MKSIAGRFIAALASLCLASCVFSQHPLSDEKTSRVDTRLIGKWIEVYKDGSLSDPHNRSVLAIGRKAGSANAMEVCSMEFEKDGSISLERVTLFSLPGERNYLSIEIREEEKKRTFYWLERYEVHDRTTLKRYPLNRDFLRDAVTQGRLKGSLSLPDDEAQEPAEENDSSSGIDKTVQTDSDSFFLTDTPEHILEFLEKHGEECFEKPEIYRLIQAGPQQDPKQ